MSEINGAILTADEDIVVFDDTGVHSISISAGSKVDVPLELVSSALKMGAYKAGKQGAAKAAVPDEDPSEKVKAIVQAYREILATGDVAKLDEAGIPRVNEVNAIVGTSNKADREAAWVIVEG